MGKYTNEKLNYLAETKRLIRSAIMDKGQSVSENDTFRSYESKIRSIVTAAGSDGSNLLYSYGNFNTMTAPTSEKRVIEHGLGVMPDFIIITCFIGLADSYDAPTFCFANGFNSKFTGITNYKSNWGFYTNRVPDPDRPPIGFAIIGVERGMDELTEKDREKGYIYTPDSRTFEIGCTPGSQFYGTYLWQAFAWLDD